MAIIKEMIEYNMILSTVDIFINNKKTKAILLDAVVWTDIIIKPCGVY